jgi:hypothetical protein
VAQRPWLLTCALLSGSVLSALAFFFVGVGLGTVLGWFVGLVA